MKITWYKVKKGLRYLKHYGPKKFLVRLQERMERSDMPYGPWFEKHKVTEKQLLWQRQESDKWENRPLVSVCVPLYKTSEEYLRQMIDSVKAQSYTNWELCLADGTPDESVAEVIKEIAATEARIRYEHLTENLGIAENTNKAFLLACGEWIGLLDHDDILAPDALYEVLTSGADADVVYTDEDKVSTDLQTHFQPHFKPDFNIDLLRSNNYITHFFVVKRRIVEKVGGFRKAFDGAQDYDFIFRCTAEAGKIAHVPRILYHWRVSMESTADNPASKLYAFEAGKRAIEENLKANDLCGEVSHLPDYGFYRVKYAVSGTPSVSIIIPNKDEAKTLQTCISSIQKSSYTNYEIIIVENNSEKQETFAYYEKLTGKTYEADNVLEGTLSNGNRVCVVTWKSGFNYSAINNYGAQFAKGEYFVLLNNDIELINEDWLTEMLGNCQRRDVGIVGAKLLYDDGSVQHAGIVIGIGGVAGNMFVGLKKDRDGYMHKASLQMDYSAVTAACLMVKAELFKQVGGLTEELTVAFNDVDFCLKVRETGHLVVYNPAVLAYHYESKSRGAEDTVEKLQRFDREIAWMKEHWAVIMENGDPFYNPNLTLKKSDYSLKV